MLRAFAVALVLIVPLCAAAQTTDEEILGKKKSEWLKLFLTETNTAKQRSLALFALESLGGKCEGVLPALLEVLKKHKDSADIRREVAQTLGRMGEDAKAAIKPLAVVMRQDPAEKVRQTAARALGGLMVPHSRVVVSDIADALKDSHEGTRAAAAETLKELGDESKTVVPKLVEALKPGKDKQADTFTRIFLAQLLGRLGKDGAAAEDVLIAIVADKGENAKVREAAAEALGRLAAFIDNPVPALEQVIKDTAAADPLRLAALLALGKVRPETSVAWPIVQHVLQETKADATLRTQAVRLAGPLGKEEPAAVAELMIVCVKDAQIETRLAAIQELGNLGPAAKDAEATLRKLAGNDTRLSIREAAAEALKKVQTPPKEKDK